MSVVSMGELLIDFVALESGVTVGEASGFQKAPGGAPANVAVAVARLGMESAFLGMVGDDPFGHYLAGVLQDEGVNTDGLRFSDQARTMLAFVSLREDGERSFMFYRHPSADMLMEKGDLALNIIEDARAFHFGSITMITEPARSATLAAADHARKHGKLISYDPNLRRALWESDDAAKAGMLLGFDYAHIVKISDEELTFLTGGDSVEPLWHDQTRMIVVTYGEKGAVLHLKDGTTYRNPGFRVSTVDTTGAGDSFVAGLLVGILNQQAEHNGNTPYLEEILRYACASGALATTSRGAIPALPTSEQVSDIVDE